MTKALHTAGTGITFIFLFSDQGYFLLGSHGTFQVLRTSWKSVQNCVHTCEVSFKAQRSVDFVVSDFSAKGLYIFFLKSQREGNEGRLFNI